MVKIFWSRLSKFLAAALLAWLIIFLTSVLNAEDVKPTVVVTTTAIESIISEIGKGGISVASLIPPDTCPGHFDLSPGGALKLNSAALILGHSFEKESFLKKVAGLTQKESAQRIVAIDVEGSWMVPDTYLSAVDEITKVLKEKFPGQAQDFESNAFRYKEQIKKESERLKANARRFHLDKVNAVASDMQKDLLDWFAIKVVATYGRPDEISASELKRLIEQARANDVRIVVDNLQSSGKAGKPIADELGIAHLTLSNFPKIYAGKVSYLDTLEENAKQLFNLVEK